MNLDIYVSAINGNDANGGLTPGTSVATLSRAYSIAVALFVPPGLTVIHMGSGTYAYVPMPFALTLLGDGAGQPGDTGFTTVVTGVSAAGTNAFQLALGSPIGVNAWRGFTIEWRSGAANGHRKSIRDNTASLVIPVEVAGFPNTSIDPGVSSNFAILRPAVILTTAASEIGAVAEIVDALDSSREYTPAALVNVRLSMSSAAAVGSISASQLRMFGVEMVGVLYLSDSNVDAGYVLPEAAMNAWAIRVGLTGFAQITRWIGWGVTWPSATVADDSWFVNETSLLRGMFVVGSFVPSRRETGQDNSIFGTIEVMGGSALGDIALYGGEWYQGNFNVLFTCRRFIGSFGSEIQISGMLCDAALTGAPMIVEWCARVLVAGILTLQNSNGNGLIVRNNSQMFIRSFTTFSAIGSGSGQGVFVDGQSELVFSNLTTVTITGGDCALRIINQSKVLCDAGAFTITANNNLRQAIEIEDNSEILFTNNSSAVVKGFRGGALVRSNSKLSVESPSGSTFAATVNGAGVQCSGGGKFYSPGGATHLVTGLGANGFGLNCRGGGQAFFLAAPTGVTGPAGDLTVGTAPADTQPNTALTASLSGFATLLSGIVRAA